MMKKHFKYFLLVLVAVMMQGCAEDPQYSECVPVSELFKVDSTNDHYQLIGIPTSTGKVGIATWITQKISEVMKASSKKVFTILASNPSFKRLIALAVTVSIMFYSLAIMLGIVQANGYQALVFAIKIIIVYQLATDWGVFYKYVGETFEAFVNSMMSYAGGTFSDYTKTTTGSGIVKTGGNTLFGDIDTMISILWNFGLIKLVLALFTTGMTGFFWGLMLLALMVFYLFAIITVIKAFLLALVGRYVMYALAPLFLIFALFSQTKSLFDNWLQQLIGFSLEPVLLFIFMGMFQMILGGMMQQIFLGDLVKGNTGGTAGDTNDVCVIGTDTGNANDNGVKMYKMRKCKYEPPLKDCQPTEETVDGSVKPAIPLDIWVILSCLILTYLMFSMVSWVSGVAGSMAEGVITVSDTAVPGFDKVQGAVKGGFQGMSRKLFEPGQVNRPK